MSYLLLFLATLLVLIAGFRFLLRKKMNPYDALLWNIVDALWLSVSFFGVLFILFELNSFHKQTEYAEFESNLDDQFQNIKTMTYGRTLGLGIDGSTPTNRRESIQWFHILQRLMEDGRQSQTLWKFVFYTQSFVLEKPGVVMAGQDDPFIFHWPENLELKPADIEFKDDIIELTDKLSNLQGRQISLEKSKPSVRPPQAVRYIYVSVFTIILALKFVKVIADYKKTLKPSKSGG